MLYKRYAAAVYQTVLCVVQDRALAEDLVQEVFWRVWRRSTRFAAERGQMVAWLRAVARNVGVDELRRLRAGPVLIRTEVEHARMRELADEQADVAASAIKQEQRHMIVAALQQLPFEQRQVIELNYFGGCSYQEIAAALNHPLGTVKTRARLGLRKLKQALLREGVWADTANLLLSIPGFGVITTAWLLVVPLNFTASASVEALTAYAGLAPQPHESGSSVRGRPQIGHGGNGRLRPALYMATLSAARTNPLIRAFYTRL